MDREGTMLNEIYQTKRKTYFPLYIESKKAKSAREGEINYAKELEHYNLNKLDRHTRDRDKTERGRQRGREVETEGKIMKEDKG